MWQLVLIRNEYSSVYNFDSFDKLAWSFFQAFDYISNYEFKYQIFSVFNNYHFSVNDVYNLKFKNCMDYKICVLKDLNNILCPDLASLVSEYLIPRNQINTLYYLISDGYQIILRS